MDKNLHDIEDLFRKGLEGNEEIPSQHAWDRIEKKLDKDNVVSIKKKYDSLKKVALLLVFLLAGLSIYIWKNGEKILLTANKDISVSKKEVRERNDTLKKDSGATHLQKPIDSLTINKNENREWLTKDSSGFTDTKNPKIGKINAEKSLNSITAENLSNNTATTNKSKINDDDETGLSKGSKLSFTKKNKLIRRKSDEVEEDKTNQIETQQPAKENLAANPFNPKLPLAISPATNEAFVNSMITPISHLIQFEKTSLQNPSKKGRKQSSFAITAFYSPDLAFYHYKNNDVGNSNNPDFKKTETESYSSTLGALIDYNISNQWGLQSGITLSNSNFDLETKTIYAQRDNSGAIKYKLSTSVGDIFVKPSFSANPNIGDSLFAKSTTHTLQYIGIPMVVTYNLYKGKFILNIISGIRANFLTRGSITTELKSGNDNETETTNRIDGLKSFYVSGLAGIGLDYNIHKNLSLSFSPTFRFALNSINSNSNVKSFPISIGFSTGLKIKL